MIVKNKETLSSQSVRQIAGNKQEQDVAFFLRRAYKDDPKVFVFNDLRFEYNDEIAQIDHLILYPYGFVLIESKSITGEVKVNNEQEWMRSYKHQWSGMRSPIKQVELQERLLRDLLHDNRKQLLPKLLGMDMLQGAFGGRCWDQLCAISSNAIVHRDDMPKDISKKLVKSEFVVDKLTKLMNIPKNKVISVLKPTDSRPWFSSESMDKISDFLIEHHKPTHTEQTANATLEPAENKTAEVIEEKQNSYTANTNEQEPITVNIPPTPQAPPQTNALACKKCKNTLQLQAAWGKYGYYVKCPVCLTNTSMKRNCPSCNSKNTKVNKQKEHYYLTCHDCNTHIEIFTQGKIFSA